MTFREDDPTTPAPRESPGDRTGVAEWVVGLGLLFGSLSGPWLTILLPAGAAFALHDRRRAARWGGAAVFAVTGALALGSAAGAVFLAGVVLAVAGTAIATARRGSGMDRASLPALGLSGAALGLGALLAPAGVDAWEEALRTAVEEGSAAAIEGYRALGVDPASLEAVRSAAETSAAWAIALWPALTATTFWLGAWLGYRLLARWGDVAPPLEERLAGRGFGAFRLEDAWLWILIAGLVALWFPAARRLGENVALVAAGLHALQGLAVVDRGLERRGWGRLSRTLVPGAAVALAPPLALPAALGIGLADHWMDFRGRGDGDAARGGRDGR